MSKLFYPSLAANSMRKNKNIYGPYLMAGSLMVALYYILWSMKVMLENGAYENGSTAMGVMSIIIKSASNVGIAVIIVILFYINSFVMKRISKELGLYCVLGMEKRHLVKIVFWQLFFSALLDLVIGMLAGSLFSQLMFLILLKLARIPAKLEFSLPLGAVGMTLSVFGAAFLLLLAYDFWRVQKTDPILLLHNGELGEREPKSRWLFALGGFAALFGGYYIALSVKNIMVLLTTFFPAVLLVVIGTYGLFVAGSIVILKGMKKWKRFFYKPENFVSVSGMIYRMKQNAAGLASICILSTMILVTMSCCLCLYLGEEGILRARYPRELNAKGTLTEEQDLCVLEEKAKQCASENSFTISNLYQTLEMSLAVKEEQGDITVINREKVLTDDTEWHYMRVIDAGTYSRLTGQEIILQKGEILAEKDGKTPEGDLTIDGVSFRVAGGIKKSGALDDFVDFYEDNGSITVVTADVQELIRLRQICGATDETLQIDFIFGADVTDTQGQEKNDCYARLSETFYSSGATVTQVTQRDQNRDDFYRLYGCLLFVGAFFVGMFLIATILIIYYKQITEGYDDRERFRIMQKVGMTRQEVKKTISRQVVLVFFLPLVMAVIHISVAFPVFSRLLRESFGMYNMPLFYATTIGSVLVFAAVYLLVYRLTAGAYYRIVQGE